MFKVEKTHVLWHGPNQGPSIYICSVPIRSDLYKWTTGTTEGYFFFSYWNTRSGHGRLELVLKTHSPKLDLVTETVSHKLGMQMPFPWPSLIFVVAWYGVVECFNWWLFPSKLECFIWWIFQRHDWPVSHTFSSISTTLATLCSSNWRPLLQLSN